MNSLHHRLLPAQVAGFFFAHLDTPARPLVKSAQLRSHASHKRAQRSPAAGNFGAFDRPQARGRLARGH